MSTALKIRFLSMAAEVRILRNEIKRRGRRVARIKIATSKDDPAMMWRVDANLAINGLCEHLNDAVRPEVRATHLARMFLKGTPLEEVERFCYSEPDWDIVERLILKHGPPLDKRIVQQNFAQWKSAIKVLKRKSDPRPPTSDKVKAERITKRSIYYEIDESLKARGLDPTAREAWWQYKRPVTGVKVARTRKQEFAGGHGSSLIEEARATEKAA